MFDASLFGNHPLLEACKKNHPDVFLVLGSGFGGFVSGFPILGTWAFSSIPGLNAASVKGHKGALTLLKASGKTILVSEGRIHHYEGYQRETVTSLVRLAQCVGCKTAILTNAAGGIHSLLNPGSVMVLENHIVTTGTLWNSDKAYPGFLPCLNPPYSLELNQVALGILRGLGVCSISGKYLMVSGPTYETPAEIRFFQKIGADAVGMSTAWEAEEAFRLGMRCLAISGISNKACGLSSGELHHEEILANVQGMSGILKNMVSGILENI